MVSITQGNLFSQPLGGPPLGRFEATLPVRPYCTDELGSLRILVKSQALKCRYIQQNSPFELRWLVYDVDRPTACFDWYDRHAPAPNIVATNMDNGHAHLFYGLEVPVLKCGFNPAVRQHPIRYAGAIDNALTVKLGADPGYAALICKNPLHNSWYVQTFESVLYNLNWIEDYLDLAPYSDCRKHLPPVGLGRNCTLFDVTRFWAYRQIRKREYFLNMDFFVYECIRYAESRNQEFPTPLPHSEVAATGKSIGKWTWKNMSPEGFISWADGRRKKSVIVRQAKSQNRADDIIAYKLARPEASNQEIADMFDVSVRTVKGLRLSQFYDKMAWNKTGGM